MTRDEKIKAVEDIIKSRLDCPNCNNEGFTVVQTRSQERVTRDMAMDAGDLSLEGSDCGQDEFEQEQCEFCYTQKNSEFNLATAIVDSMGIDASITENIIYHEARSVLTEETIEKHLSKALTPEIITIGEKKK